jgi:hypothetical protein
MHTLTAAFKTIQAMATRTPLVKLEAATFGWPAVPASADFRWTDFAWERLTAVGDNTAVAPHSVATPSDGSVIRIRNAGGTLYQQRVTSPSASSDWTAGWTSRGTIPSGNPVAVIARTAEVIMFADDGTYLYRRESADSGATWGSWTGMSNTRPCERGLAAAFKSNGDCAVVHASDVNDPSSLYIQIRTGGAWSTGLGQIYGDFEIYGLALYHDGDWNIIALIADGSYLRLARAIYGDGDQYAAGDFSGFVFLDMAKAKVDYSDYLSIRQFQTKAAGKKTATWWERTSIVLGQRAIENIGVDHPYLCYHSNLGTVFSVAKDNAPWFYLLSTGTEFKDSDWHKAMPLETIATEGLAMACDGSYLYATAPNQVWRTTLPGTWAPPAGGSGIGTYYQIPYAHILKVEELVRDFAPSSLVATIDNSSGAYDALGYGSGTLASVLRRGSRLRISIGYKAGATEHLSIAARYSIEAIEYVRAPNVRTMQLYCVDSWYLMQRYTFNRPVTFNYASNVDTVYAIIEKLCQAIGGSLTYVTRSSDMTSVYPRLEVRTGESAAGVLRQLLQLVPDTIFFNGLTGYIVYPQSTDTPSYYFVFPQ